MLEYPFTGPSLYVLGFFKPKRSGGSCEIAAKQTLQSDLLRVSGEYGRSAKLRGNELFVGEPGALGSIFVVGEVHYYTRVDDTSDFVRQSGFFSPTQSNGSQFGSDIDYDGSRVVVGEPNVSKQANVFTFAAGVASSEQEIQANTYTESASQFGTAVAIEGSHLLIGAPGQDITESNQGGVEYWTESAGTWTFQQAFTHNGTPVSQARFGQGIAMVDDSTAFITWRGAGTTSHVEKWTRAGTTWSYDSEFTITDYDIGTLSQKIDTDGTNLIIGFPDHDDGGLSTANYGAAIVTTQAGTILSEIIGGTTGNRLGQGVTLDGDEAVIGEPFDDPSATSNAGTAEVYDVCV